MANGRNSQKERKPRGLLSLRAKEKKEKKERPRKEDAPLRSEVGGLALISAVLVSIIALLSSHAHSGGGNLLGPYLGKWWADFLNQALGGLPVLVYLAAFAVLGVQLVLGRNWWRPVGILAAMAFFIGLLLSVRFLGHAGAVDFRLSGGWVGIFLSQRLFLPVFGTSHFGPYLVSGIFLLLLAVWGGQLSLSALLTRTAGMAGAMGRSLAEGWRKAEPEALAVPAPKATSRAAKAQAAPKATNLPLPTAEDSPEEEKAKLEALLDSGDLEGLDPLTIRKIRDLALERKRVSGLNDWEQKARNPEIAGLMGKDAEAREARKGRRKKEEKAEPEVAAAGITGDSLRPAGLESETTYGDAESAPGEDFESEVPVPAPAPRAASKKTRAAAPVAAGEADAKPAVQYDPYRLPSLDAIFADPPQQPLEFTEEELREQSRLLEDQLLNFKVMGKVTQIHPGPVITRYEVELAPGVKVNRISNLADDLALALRAKSIRILAPIPGKSVVGIEVPNRKAQIVYIKEILSAPEFRTEQDTLKIAVGKTIGGEPYVADLTRAPHLLIAGQTGSGKSVCINSIMASLLVSKTPDELRMILVDPKVVELKPYDAIPHLLHPVITQPDVAVQALKWATVEMDRRYEVLALCGVRNIKGFNQKYREGKLPESVAAEDNVLMPYILIVIDELADLMMVAGKEVETNIARIAQKARAVGLHLILATQRPSTNVITGTIKANLPTRMAFQVASQIDARTILDRQGAEKLLGRGDMLYRPIEFPEPVRLHGCYIDDEQCEAIAGACSGQFVNYPQVKTFNLEEDPEAAGQEDVERDEKFTEAAELVVQLKQASVSLLQRRLGLGYARSGRLVDQLERAGVVGRERGSKPREVLMGEEELRSFLSSNAAVDSA